MKIQKHGPRTILTERRETTLPDGSTVVQNLPVIVELAMRQATTAPNRIKAALLANTEEGVMPLPYSVPTLPNGDVKPGGYGIEFRLEMN